MNNTNNNKLNFIIKITYFLYIFAIVYIIVKYALAMAFPFIIAFAVSLITEPFITFFCIKLKLRRNISVIFCLTLFYVIIIMSFYLFSRITASGINTLFSNLPDKIKKIESVFNQIQSNINNSDSIYLKRVSESVINYFKSISPTQLLTGSFGSKILTPISDIIKAIPSYFFCCIITIIASYFISFSLTGIKEKILKHLDKNKREFILRSKTVLVQVIKKYLKAYCILMSITFLELLFLFWIFKINPPFLSAFLISIVDILPVLGAGTVLIPWAVITFLTGNITKSIVLLSIYLLVTVIRQIAEPKIIGQSIGINPLITLISIYFGFRLFGLLGVVTVPIIVLLFSELYQKQVIKI